MLRLTNPFNPATTINFALPERASVNLSIYNLLGEKIIELVNGELEAGYYEKVWDAGSYPSGVYLYRLQANSIGGSVKSFVESKKLMLIK